MHILIPKRTQLRKRLKTNDDLFYDFIKGMLEIDPNLRLSAGDALRHPWISKKYE
jgi:serine/threonine protein kinase